MTEDFSALPHEKGFKALVLIWGAMVFSLAVYAAIAWRMPVRGPSMESSKNLVLVLGVVSAGLFLVQIRVHQNLRDEKLFPRILDLGSWGLRQETTRQLQELQVPERGVQLILQAHIVFGVVIWAMAEAVATFGLFLTLLDGHLRYMAAFGGVALAQFLWFRPKEEAFREQVKRWHRYVATGKRGV